MFVKPNDLTLDEVVHLTSAKPSGNGYSGLCPVHGDKKPSLSISQADNKLLLKCHAGCEFDSIIAALRARLGAYAYTPSDLPRPSNTRQSNEESRKAFAEQIWKASRPLTNASRAQAYFRGRGLSEVSTNALRFHPDLRHPTNQSFPAIVAKISDLDGLLLGIHRTYLSHENAGKAPVDPQKMMMGNLRDGAVHLAAPGRILLIGEGLETCLSAMQATGLSAWAALSASRLIRISIPDCVHEVVIVADHDNAGIKAAYQAGRRWIGQGKRVRIAKPPMPGQDFNDMLRGETSQ